VQKLGGGGGDHFPYHLSARCQLTPIPSCDSDDESDSSIPPPKTQTMKRQQEKQPSVLPSAFTHKSAFGDRKKREQGNDGIREHPTKKIITVQRCKEQKQNVTNMARIDKKKMEAQKQTKAKSEVVKQIAAETISATKAKKEAQKESVAELASTFKDKRKR